MCINGAHSRCIWGTPSLTIRAMGKKRKQVTSSSMSLRLQEGLGLLLVVAAFYISLSLVTYNPADPSFNNATPTIHIANSGGLWGAYLADGLLMLFGLAAFVPVAILLTHAVWLMSHRRGQELVMQLMTLPLLLVCTCVLLQMISPMPHWPTATGFGNGGLIGKLLMVWCAPNLGWVGCFLTFFSLGFMSLLWFAGWTLTDVWSWTKFMGRMARYIVMVTYRNARRIKFKKASQFDLPLATPKVSRTKAKVERPVEEKIKPAKRVEGERQSALPLNLNDGYALPPLHMLDPLPSKAEMESEEALQQNARRLEAELKNFGVEGTVNKICPGPVITIYELQPAPGVKTSTVLGLADDLARAMSAMAIRIAAIPGRSVIGIEMPNRSRQSVSLRELLETEAFETHPGKLTVAMGVDTTGQPIYSDIAKMPHALIAGTTGSGKSVAMNAFILSLLYRMTPEQLRFVMIDPKMLELSIYNDIPHLLTPVITDPNKAAGALNWVVKEMENRYRLMSELGVKNLGSFNAKLSELLAEGRVPTRMVQTGFDLHTGQPQLEEQPLADKPLPHIVVVIDELADLMMVAGKTVELYIARLTQMARASGIHLLVATQRPSVDVVTGLIKANIPTRIAFSVTSKIDSRTVLDSMGAEQLLGKGDMLYMANGSNGLQRLHGAFVSEEECTQVADHLKAQGTPTYIEDITKPAPTGGSVEAGSGSDGDELYQDAVSLIAREQKASTSFIQRHLKIGYNRAATMIEQMESDGYVSPADHVGKREVRIKQPPQPAE